jgi:hypothetical protein
MLSCEGYIDTLLSVESIVGHCLRDGSYAEIEEAGPRERMRYSGFWLCHTI